jgi:signal transduction histidine kinase
MGISLPFERWVQSLAALAEHEREPERFLSLALRDLADLPWIVGITWQARQSAGEVGSKSPRSVEYSFQDMKLIFYTRWTLSPALILHVKLLSEMLGHFYAAKQREEARRNNAYSEAIYETGARLTHDVKNLLQSLRGLCAAAESSGSDEAAALQSLIKGQLPQIAQRLTTTLEKLTIPQLEGSSSVGAIQWWENLKQRYTRREILFVIGEAPSDACVPIELFDSVAENLLQNVITKLQQHDNVQVTVRFEPAALRLTVCDTGTAIAPEIASRLLRSPVQSDTGLGIGLYHAAKQAQQLGYELKLTANAEGNVCFELCPTPVS